MVQARGNNQGLREHLYMPLEKHHPVDVSVRRDTPIAGLRSGQHIVHLRKQRLYIPSPRTTNKHPSKPLSPLKRQHTCPTQLPDMLHIRRSCMHSTHKRTTVRSSSRYNCSLATLGRRSHASLKRRHRVLGPVAPEACAEDPWSSLVLLVTWTTYFSHMVKIFQSRGKMLLQKVFL